MIPALVLVPWTYLFRLGLKDDEYTHVLLVPFIAAALIYADRRKIFSEIRCCRFAIFPMVFAMGLLAFGQRNPELFSHPEGLRLFLATALGIGVLMADFSLCFGVSAFRRALFPLVFLLLSVPVPKPAMSRVIGLLQEGSAAFSAILFRLIGMPALRQGFAFSLPGFDIKVAEQCSGIRSSIVLCIASVLAGHLFLRAFWRKLLLVMLTVPLVIFKNAVRIVTISTLAVYINHGFLYGRLHYYSGIPFSLVEFAVVTPLLIGWRNLETRTSYSTQPAAGRETTRLRKDGARTGNPDCSM